MTSLPPARFSLDPTIDWPVLADDFARCGRVQIAPFLKPEDGADLLLRHVSDREDWRVNVMTAADKAIWFDRPSWNALKPQEREGVLAIGRADGRKGLPLRLRGDRRRRVGSRKPGTRHVAGAIGRLPVQRSSDRSDPADHRRDRHCGRRP